MMKNRRDKCINTPERQHLNRRILIGKRYAGSAHASAKGAVSMLSLGQRPRICRMKEAPALKALPQAAGECCALGAKKHTIQDNPFYGQPFFCRARPRLISRRMTQ